MIDISHGTDEVINQVLDMTDVPVIASHSSCRYFTPGWERNMGDDEIRRLKDNGGVIQINYGSSFITQASQDKRAANAEKINIYAEKNGLSAEDKAFQLYAKKVNEENPIYADVTEVIDHFDRVVELAGIDHVGIGSDYDGVEIMPTGLENVSKLPFLTKKLIEHGYTIREVRKILGGNFKRIFKEVCK